ncbi:MAG: hypothetical protein OSJ68_00530 [Clostridia bacterium]|nr:hypothetical protein [Clostridia bacterium]
MKKSTVLILLIVFLGSVLVVGIFGLRSVPYEKLVYAKEIVPTSVTTMLDTKKLPIKEEVNDKGERYYYVVVPYEENLTLLINYRLTPADCTNKTVRVSIVYPTSNPPAAIGDKNSIVFNRKGSVHLLYSTTDSASGPTMDFWIYTY